MNMEEKVYQIPLEQIIPNRFQPRLTFDENALNELAESIKQHGIIQPLVLRKVGDKFEIIAGERRFKAAGIAGLKTVPAVISQLDDQKTAEVALVENVQRKNLTAIEEAKSYKNILEQGGMTQDQLASKLGVSQSTIANKLRLLNLSDEVQDALLNEKISERHARALLAVEDKTEQVKWLNKIINDRLTVRQLDMELKKALKSNDEIDDESVTPIVDLNPNIDDIKQNALDLNPQEGLHDIESMLKPSTPGEKTYDLSTPIDNIESLDIDGGEEKMNEQEVKQTQNKLFNVLEDEVANMNANNSIDDMMNAKDANPVVEQIVQPVQPIVEAAPNLMDQSPIEPQIQQTQAVETPIIPGGQAPIMDQPIQQPVEQPIINPDIVQNAAPVEQIVNNDTLNNSININQQPIMDNNNFISTPGIIDNNQPITSDIQENIGVNTQEQQIQSIVDNNLTQLDNSINNVTNTNLNDTIDPTNINPSSTVNDDTIIQNNPGNTFFNFSTTPANTVEPVNNIIEPAQNTNIQPMPADNNSINVIEPVVQTQTQPVFDPMSMVNTLDPSYQEQVAQEAGISINNAINEIRSVRDSLEQRGFAISMEEADLGDSYNIIININKGDN